ncbi:transposase [Roseofilum casamattae]|uniref:Transposase n=1 Tax=Roseofilum casamattae BLCC-M143 TaxID=3022442 RepID=A0ABT7C4C8_9CYAN|nr:transposase [Roseofilum casamattae]MDJ1185543.1 transposase [Roseofilum casamattae BLCC-M143]
MLLPWGSKEAWYILTSLSDMDLALDFYACRWSIETLFKDCKSGGYNLEQMQVNEQRLRGILLVMVMAYTLATLQGIAWQKTKVNSYLARPTEKTRMVKRHSNFYLGCYGFSWISSFQCWSELAEQLMQSKAHKRYFYRQGLQALSLTESML